MKIILYRYLVREQLIPFCICFLGLTLILIMGRLMQVTRYLFTSSLTFSDLAELMALALPKLALYALPMATLVGILLAFVRLNEDSELIAMRAAGISFRQFLPAVVCIVLLTTFLSFLTAIYILPAANGAFRTKLKTLGRASIPALLQEGMFIDMIPHLVFFFEKVRPGSLSIEGIFIQDTRHPKVSVAIVAQRAQLLYLEAKNQILFRISDGVITQVGSDLDSAHMVSFKVYDFCLPLDELLQDVSGGPKQKGEMSLSELFRAVPLGKSPNSLRYALEFHQRLALPVSCLLLGLIAAPLGALFRQGRRIAGVTLGLAVFLIYYVVLSAGKGLGENGLISPFFAIWTPNILTTLLAFYLWDKMQHGIPHSLALIRKRRRKKEL